MFLYYLLKFTDAAASVYLLPLSVRMQGTLRKTRFMLRLNPTRTFQTHVDGIYSRLEKNVLCDLKSFEFYMRKIHILNGKIINLSTDYRQSEDDYDFYR